MASFFKIGKKVQSKKYYKLYNNQGWFIRAVLYNIKRDINIQLLTLNINEMILFNSILCYIPTLELTYIDLDQMLIKLLDTNDLFLSLEIGEPPPTNSELWLKLDLNMTLLFNINKVSIIDKKDTDITYKFEASLNNQNWLLQNTNFATIKNAYNLSRNGSPLIIISNLLGSIGYPKEGCIVNDTLNRVDFISSQTMNIKDCIDYLLRRAVSPHDPPTYFVHNIRSGNAMLINNKNYEKRLKNPSNIFNVYGKADSKKLAFNLAIEASNITNNSFNAGILALRYLSEFTYTHFDHNTRTWTKTIYDYNTINLMFNGWVLKLSNGKYESVFPIPLKVESNLIKHSFPNYNEDKMYLFLRLLQLGTNSITINVYGNITRDAGQYVTLNCANEAQIPRYEGLWNIYSCKHIWSGVTYHNQLVCYRTWNIKPLLTKAESQQNI